MSLAATTDAAKVILDRSSVVLVGSFNPTIFQPAWFGKHELLRASEAEEAEVRLINPQLTHFHTEWVELQITRNRFFAIDRNGGYEQPLVDLVTSVFSLLEHTPTTALGMNREIQYEFDTVERWHRFGDSVAPKSMWSSILERPGLVGMQMQSPRPGVGNVVNIIVNNRGERRADIDINEHRVLGDTGGAAAAVKTLRDEWARALTESTRMADALIGTVL